MNGTDRFYYMGFGLTILFAGLVALLYSLNFVGFILGLLLWLLSVGAIITLIGLYKPSETQDNRFSIIFGLALILFSSSFSCVVLNIFSFFVGISIIMIVTGVLIVIYTVKQI